MTQSRFFQIALFFPVLIWCLCLLVFSLLNHEGGGFILNNMSQAHRVLVPYVIFAGFIWKTASRKGFRDLVCLAAFIPLVWGVFFTFFYVIVSFIAERTIEKWYILGIMAFWATLAGYVMELIPFIILNVFKNDFKPDTLNPSES